MDTPKHDTMDDLANIARDRNVLSIHDWRAIKDNIGAKTKTVGGSRYVTLKGQDARHAGHAEWYRGQPAVVVRLLQGKASHTCRRRNCATMRQSTQL